MTNLEAAALELFNTRKANLARRDRGLAEAMVFEGEEKAFCIQSVRRRMVDALMVEKAERKAREERAAYLGTFPIERIEHRIEQIKAEIDRLPYASFMTRARDKERALRAELIELSAYVAECQTAHSVAAE